MHIYIHYLLNGMHAAWTGIKFNIIIKYSNFKCDSVKLLQTIVQQYNTCIFGFQFSLYFNLILSNFH